MSTTKPTTVDEYIAQAPAAAREKLRELREILREAAPGAQESLKWGQPAFSAEYILFVYAGYTKHISIHPTPSVVTAFAKQLHGYKASENTVQFPLDEPLPRDLILHMAKRRVEESRQGVTWM